MPRLPRELYQGYNYFHILVQGINKENIFIDNRKKYEYMKLMNKYKKEYNVEIIAYCVMSNHVHILANVNKIEQMTSFMHKVNTNYGIYYNKNLERVGFVFRNRFETQVIKDLKYLFNCIIYIHNNPVKAGICNYAKDYKFSSYFQFMSNSFFDELFQNEIRYELEHYKRNKARLFFIQNDSERQKEIMEDIESYLKINNINLAELRVNANLLLPIANRLKEVYQLSNRSIGTYLNVGREKIRSVLK